MKKLFVVLMSLAFGILFVSGAMAYDGAYTPGNGINGTVHDLSRAVNGMNYIANPADSLQRICIFCHTPHHSYRLSEANGGPAAGIGSGPQAGDAFTYLPLWNHELTGNFASYTMYSNGPGSPDSTAKASQAEDLATAPGANSLLCLSCHDGSVAVNSYGNTSQPTTSQSLGGGATIGAAYLIGKDNFLGNHHPIGFSYSAVQDVDTGLRPPTTNITSTDSIESHLYGGGNMECGTCHSVHNTGNNGEKLLWRSDANSQLCLTCHDKGDYTAP